MFSTLETIAIIGIIVVQLIIAIHTYRKIDQMKSFLPEGRQSLMLKEYEIPAGKNLKLEPSQVVDKITYVSSKTDEEEAAKGEEDTQPHDERGRFASKRTSYSPIHDGIDLDEAGILPY